MNDRINLLISVFVLTFCMFCFITLEATDLVPTKYISNYNQKIILLFVLAISSYQIGRYQERRIHDLDKFNLSGNNLGK